jgi:hypothetical protein
VAADGVEEQLLLAPPPPLPPRGLCVPDSAVCT